MSKQVFVVTPGMLFAYLFVVIASERTLASEAISSLGVIACTVQQAHVRAACPYSRAKRHFAPTQGAKWIFEV